MKLDWFLSDRCWAVELLLSCLLYLWDAVEVRYVWEISLFLRGRDLLSLFFERDYDKWDYVALGSVANVLVSGRNIWLSSL